MAGTTIKRCTCESAFQDQLYGKGNRLYNLREDGKRGTCTVCGKKE